MELETLDHQEDVENEKNSAWLRKRVKILAIMAVSGGILNIVLHEAVIIDMINQNLFEPSSSFVVFTVGMALWGAILGFLFALIPYRGFPYSKRYVAALLWVVAILQGIYVLLFLIIIVRRTLGI